MTAPIALEAIEARSPSACNALLDRLHVDGWASVSARTLVELETAVIGQARELFAMPLAAKEALDLSRSPHARGYVGLRRERTNGVPDLKESFEFAEERLPVPHDPDRPYLRLYGPNQWPDARLLPQFRSAIEAYTSLALQTGRTILRGLLSALAQPVDEGVPGGLLKGGICAFSRLIYYAPAEDFAASAARLQAHTDHTLLTLVLEDSPGLEVRERHAGWREVGREPGTFVVFCGELMEFWTRGYVSACLHRVHNAALRSDRVSISSFFLPDLEATIAPIDASELPPSAGAPTTVSGGNSWLGPDGELRPIAVGQEEWKRMAAIFPDDVQAEGDSQHVEER